jgi:uncharacterized membrane protein YtjA (UPF0391 family)
MFYWAVVLFILALVTGVLGLAGVAGISANIALIFFAGGLVASLLFFTSPAGHPPCDDETEGPEQSRQPPVSNPRFFEISGRN